MTFLGLIAGSCSAFHRMRFSLSGIFLGLWRRLDMWVDGHFLNKEGSEDGVLAREFLSDAEAIEEMPVPVSLHAAVYVVLGLLVVAILWSVVGKVDRIVVTSGKIVTRTPLVVLQPFSTSRILHLHVKPGDHVTRGTTLVSFDPAFAQADEAALAQKFRTLSAEVDRIDAQLGEDPKFTADLGSGPERIAQAAIFAQQMAEYLAEMDLRNRQVAEIDSQIRAQTAMAEGLKRQIEMANKITGIREALLRQGAGAPLELLNAQSTEIDFENKLKNAIGEIQKLAQQRAQIEAERQTFRGKWRDQLRQRLVQARQELADSTETLKKALKMSDLTELKSPLDGVVLEMADRSVGSVSKEAETLVTLVPDNAELYAETNIQSRDVGYVKVGDPVRIKLEAFPFQTFGTINGRLLAVSPDSVPIKAGDSSQYIFHAQIQVSDSTSDLIRRGVRLRPGLVMAAEIKTGSRRIISYVLEPVLRIRDESLREP